MEEVMKEPKLNTDSDKKENSGIAHREHREFHNCYTVKSITNDIRFLNMIYDGKTELTDASVTPELINNLKYLGKRIYFFILSMDKNFNPNAYIKRKYEFINNYFSGGNPHLFFLAWNGLIKNDSFKRLMMQVFNLRRFNSELCPQNIPHFGSNMTRYRTKLVLADDMATDEKECVEKRDGHLMMEVDCQCKRVLSGYQMVRLYRSFHRLMSLLIKLRLSSLDMVDLIMNQVVQTRSLSDQDIGIVGRIIGVFQVQ
jgi:hypothetical protein